MKDVRPISRRRSRHLSALIVLAATIIGLRLYDLQVVRSERYRARAQDQHRNVIDVPAIRGSILDREGTELAVTLDSFSLYARPALIEEPQSVAAGLAPVIGVQASKILASLRSGRRFVYLRKFLDPPEAERIRGLLPELPFDALGFDRQPKRRYPHGRLGVHVVGYSTIDDEGIAGVELTYDDILRGDPEVQLVLQDAHSGRTTRVLRASAKQPQDVVLTIDHVLQYIVERELEQALRDTRAQSASAVLIEPSSGQVLALANLPAADPNAYGKASAHARTNRAIVHYYEPGSTFKVISMAAALDSGRVRMDEAVFCENGLYVKGSRRIHDVSARGWLTPREVLVHSSNVGMVKLVDRLAASELLGKIHGFGFGTRTGIELPGESPGALAALEKWSGFTKDSLAFGQEIGVTAVQMAAALAAVAHDGVWVQPRVVLGIRDADGTFRPAPPGEQRRVVSSHTAGLLRSMLQDVVGEGTGRRAAVEGYLLAGKSGTAQKSHAGARGYDADDYVASFGGFGPQREPRLALLVLLDSPRGAYQGGQVAAPVFGRIMIEALRHLRVEPDVEPPPPMLAAHENRRAAAVAPPERPGAAAEAYDPAGVPAVVGASLREAVRTLAAHGCRVRAEGEGYVTAQSPSPGTRIEPGSECRIRLSPHGATSAYLLSRDSRSAG